MTHDSDNVMSRLRAGLLKMGDDLRMHAYLSIMRTADEMLYHINKNAAKYGLNQTTIAILYYLIMSGGTLTPTELSIKTGRTKQTITPAIDNLEKKGYIKRDEIGEDRRTRSVSITENGLKLVDATFNKNRDMYFKLMSSLENDSLKQISLDMKLIRKNIHRQTKLSKKRKNVT